MSTGRVLPGSVPRDGLRSASQISPLSNFGILLDDRELSIDFHTFFAHFSGSLGQLLGSKTFLRLPIHLFDGASYVLGPWYLKCLGAASARLEQFVGQELIAYGSTTPLSPPTYWHREARGSAAEVDYVIQRGVEILPIEVKEGTTGSMKSLHIFLAEKPAKRGIKVSKMGFSDDGTVRTIPFYAIECLFGQAG